MYTLSDLRQLHIEVSTQCNAECPMCCRNLFGRTSPGLVETSMSLARFRELVPDELVSRLEVLDICGAYGDPAMAPELLDICQHVSAANPGCQIRVYSNGGIRTDRWWARLASVGGITVIFAIDGIQTNHVYRRRVNIEKVLRNAAAFIAAGGTAQWDFIVFAHNENEVEDARRMSESMGFETFAVKRTARFLRPLYEPAPELREQDGIDVHPIYNRQSVVVGELRPPADARYVNEVLQWAQKIESKAEYFDRFFAICNIRCLALDSSSVFMSVGGHVYPCCWLYVQATLPEIYGGVANSDPQVRNLLAEHGGSDLIDAAQRPLSEIIQGPFFEAVQASWTKDSLAGGKLKVCARVCGDGFGAYRKQFDQPELVP